jgi:hypothetical protein
MYHIENSQAITGYTVKMLSRAAFNVVGFTRLIPPHQDQLVDQFWEELRSDGRLEKLRKASNTQPWLLGMGTWDPECAPKGFRYTVCIEETPYTDFTSLGQEYELFSKEIGASDWMCFETTEDTFNQRFWKDNPYKMMGPLGYQFHSGDYSVGLHFDAYPPAFVPNHNMPMEFWITVRCAE